MRWPPGLLLSADLIPQERPDFPSPGLFAEQSSQGLTDCTVVGRAVPLECQCPQGANASVMAPPLTEMDSTLTEKRQRTGPVQPALLGASKCNLQNRSGEFQIGFFFRRSL